MSEALRLLLNTMSLVAYSSALRDGKELFKIDFKCGADYFVRMFSDTERCR
jgi:hypothetical protein